MHMHMHMDTTRTQSPITPDIEVQLARWAAQRSRIDREVQLANMAAQGSWAARLSLADAHRVLAWLDQARGSGPYGVLELRGARSSGKSTLLRALAELAAGGSCALAHRPDNRRELAQSVHLLHVVAIDDAGLISGRLAAAICQAAAGDLQRWRRTDTLPARPVIVVGTLNVSLWARARYVTTVVLAGPAGA